MTHPDQPNLTVAELEQLQRFVSHHRIATELLVYRRAEAEAHDPALTQPLKTIDELTQSHTAWYCSNNDEIWIGGPFETRDEAEAEAEACGYALITQATKTAIRLSKQFDADDFIETAEEDLYDLGNEDSDLLLGFSGEVQADLQARVRAAIDAWQVAHQIAPQPSTFDRCDGVQRAAWTKAEDSPAPDLQTGTLL